MHRATIVTAKPTSIAPAAESKKTAVASGASEAADLKTLGNVELALYTGQFTRDESSGVDLLIVGNLNPNKAQKFVTELEAKEGKEIQRRRSRADRAPAR